MESRMSRILKEALETIVALKDGYKGGTDDHSKGRQAGYRLVGDLAETALKTHALIEDAHEHLRKSPVVADPTQREEWHDSFEG
jgi:hypothetical protein